MVKTVFSLVAMTVVYASEAIHNSAPSANLHTEGVPMSFEQMQNEKFAQTRLGSNSTGDGEGDPDCEKGVVDKYMTVCCSASCGGDCGEHALCKYADRFQKLTGQNADSCCKDRIFKNAAPSCDEAGPPCIMKAGSGPGSTLRDWSETMQDCKKSTCAHRLSSSLAALKGDFLVKLALDGDQIYQQAKAIATQVMYASHKKIAESKILMGKLRAKILGASESDLVKDPLTGQSIMSNWEDSYEDAESDASFFALVLRNGGDVKTAAQEGIKAGNDLQAKAMKVEDVKPLNLELELVIGEANKVYRDAEALTKMFKDASKDYTCGAPPVVKHAASQCQDGNTKFSRKCNVVCEKGFDGEGTRNALRCNRQGKVGEQLYGEWAGIAACVGRLCGQAKDIPHAKTVKQDIRHAHSATYTCHEGFENKKGDSSFKVECGADGNFHHNLSHVCQPVKCGHAPKMANTKSVRGTFYYADIATYKCLEGFTVDEMPGGLKQFSVSCQSTESFSQGVGCKRVRCGPQPDFEHTKLISTHQDDSFFEDEAKFQCQEGYTTNQEPNGPDHFTLRCSVDGEFHLKRASGDQYVPSPKCLAVSAGVPPEVKHGKFMRHEMFFGESVLVVADSGYSTTGKATTGPSFTLTVTKEGTFDGLEKFIPVVCGKAPTVQKAKTSFEEKQASYGDLLQYECEEGYSTDKTDAPASNHFTVECGADGLLTEVPGVGHCANINDCLGHTCGPHGKCVDHIMNYTCQCEGGFDMRKDEKTQELHCGNIDDCGPEACGAGKCVDLTNDYKCDCPTGYEQVEEFTGKESDKKGADKTDSADKTCHPVTCGTPSEVENGAAVPADALDQKLSYDAEVLYRCGLGFSLDGTANGKKEFSVKCQADTKFTAMKECKPIKCAEVPSVVNAATKSTSATFNESIHFDCGKGHSIDGTDDGARGFSMTCQATGEFVEPADGFKGGGWGLGCKAVSCPEPLDVPNAHRPAAKMVYEDSVEYECFTGFTLDGEKAGKTKFKVDCQEDGKLTKTKQCFAKSCGKPLPQKVLYASTQDEGLVRYPMNTEVMCQDGYTVDADPHGNKTFVVTCLASGEFEPFDPKQCKPVTCGEPPEMVNATFKKMKSHIADRPSLNYGERATYDCKTGFTTGGEWDAPKGFQVECLASGQFSAPANNMQCRNVNDCEGHTCGPKGTCVDLIGQAPAYTCKCEAGFHIETVDGDKLCGKDACKDHDCGVGVCTDLIGDYTCACPSGYFIGLTEAGLKSCIPVQCSLEAPSVENGKMLTGHNGALVFPSTLRYECEPGFSVDGTVSESKKRFQTQCRADGQLHGLMGCQKISCGTAHILPFAKLLLPSSPGTSIDYNDKGKYECDEGYTIKGKSDGSTTFEVTCPENGILTQPGVCEPVKCGEAPALEHTQMAISGGVFYFGQGLTYQCVMGYTLDGTPSGDSTVHKSCLKTGEFSISTADDEQACKPMSTAAPSITNAVMSKYAGEEVTSIPSRVTYPNGLEYKCKRGYSSNGSPSGQTIIIARVDSTGKFSPALPSECLIIKYKVHGQVKNARNGIAMDSVRVSVEGTDIADTTRAGYSRNGFFTLQEVPSGSHTLVYEKDGYIRTTKQIDIQGDVVTGGASDISMSPIMSSDQWRGVLKWSRKPSDLDTYVKWGSSKVWYSGREVSSYRMSAHLEHDDTTSFGPETVHMTGVGECQGGAFDCDIRYYVNDYTETGVMPTEGAEVTLYTGERVAGAWKIADCPQSVSEDGNWWHVFTLDGTTNKLKWSCDHGPSALPPTIGFLQNSESKATKVSAVNIDKTRTQHLRARAAA